MDIGGGKSRKKKSLPHELLIEILSWLPVQYLCRLRYVSKTWLQLISHNPYFAKLHLERSAYLKINPSIVALKATRDRFYLAADYTNCDNAIPLDLPFDQQGLCCIVHGSCNGLLCLSSIKRNQVHIWNPITNEHITIPGPTTPSWCTGCSDELLGFGFHPTTSEYKVVKVFGKSDYESSEFHSQVSVYTLGINSSWRIVVVDAKYNILCSRNPACALVYGVVHWLRIGRGSYCKCAIVSFDLKGEFLQEIPPPNDANLDDELTNNSVMELGGDLCLICDHDQYVQIWVMKEYGVVDSWIKQFKIGQPEVTRFYSLSALGAHNGDIVLKKNMSALILYHPKTNSISNLNGFHRKICIAHFYIGSIVSPKAINEPREIMTPGRPKD